MFNRSFHGHKFINRADFHFNPVGLVTFNTNLCDNRSMNSEINQSNLIGPVMFSKNLEITD